MRKRTGRKRTGFLHRLINKPAPWQAPPRLPQAALPRGPLLVTLTPCEPLPVNDLFEDFINRRFWQASIVSLELTGLKEETAGASKGYSLRQMLLTRQRTGEGAHAKPQPFVDVIIWAAARTYRVLAAQHDYLRGHLLILENEHRRVFGNQLDGIAVRYFFALDEQLAESSEHHPVLAVQFGETVCFPRSDNDRLVMKIKADSHAPWQTCAGIKGMTAAGVQPFTAAIATNQTHQTQLLLHSTVRRDLPQGVLRFAEWPGLDSGWLLLSIDSDSNKIIRIQGTAGPLDFTTDVYGATAMLTGSGAQFYLAHASGKIDNLKKSQYRLGYLEFSGFAVPRLEQGFYRDRNIATWQLYLDPELNGLKVVERNKSDLINNAGNGYVCIIAMHDEEKGMIYSDRNPHGIRSVLHPVHPATISETSRLVLHPLHRTLSHHASILLADDLASAGRWELESDCPQKLRVELDNLPVAEVCLDPENIPVACLPQKVQITLNKNALDDWFIEDRQDDMAQVVLKNDLSARQRGESGVYLGHGDYIIVHNYVLRFSSYEYCI